MSRTIMSAWEVAQCSPLMVEYPMDILCVFIAKDERGLFDECSLGYDLYEAMINDLEDVSDVLVYDSEELYNIEDKVKFEDIVLESLVDNNAIEPCDVLAKQFWRAVNKFNSNCYQELYDNYLKYYIAFSIAGRSARFATYQGGSRGIVKYSEDFRGQGTGLITVSSIEFYEWKRDILHEAERAISGVLEYIKDKHNKFMESISGGCDFSDIKGIEEMCNNCDPKKDFKKKRSKFHFIK